MRLIGSPTSPYVRKVLIVAHETGMASRLEVVNGSGTPLAPHAETIAVNPLGKVPCLLRDEGPALFDSRVICQYLNAVGGGDLAPEGDARWTSLTLEAIGDGILDAALLTVYETRLRPEEIRFDPWVEGQKAKVNRALDHLETRWTAALSGPLTLGSIAVGAALGYIDFRNIVGDWRATRPSLARWSESFLARPSVLATAPVG